MSASVPPAGPDPDNAESTRARKIEEVYRICKDVVNPLVHQCERDLQNHEGVFRFEDVVSGSRSHPRTMNPPTRLPPHAPLPQLCAYFGRTQALLPSTASIYPRESGFIPPIERLERVGALEGVAVMAIHLAERLERMAALDDDEIFSVAWTFCQLLQPRASGTPWDLKDQLKSALGLGSGA